MPTDTWAKGGSSPPVKAACIRCWAYKREQTVNHVHDRPPQRIDRYYEFFFFFFLFFQSLFSLPFFFVFCSLSSLFFLFTKKTSPTSSPTSPEMMLQIRKKNQKKRSHLRPQVPGSHRKRAAGIPRQRCPISYRGCVQASLEAAAFAASATAGVRTRSQWRVPSYDPQPLRETALQWVNLEGRGVSGAIRLCPEWHSGGIIFPGGTCADVPLARGGGCTFMRIGRKWNEMEWDGREG
ncbi:hypothetical protein J3F84DRAFT_160769 [Trichoderma pleuroticola]